MRILIVDDSDSVRHILSTIFSSLDFDVTEAANGAAALDYLKTHATDAIMTDFNMPGMDGLTFVEQARKLANGADIPVFVLSSETCPLKMERALRCGVTAWMTKPMSPPGIVTTVMKAVA